MYQSAPPAIGAIISLSLALAACSETTATPRPLAIYIAQATQDVSAAQTQQAAKSTATFERQAYNATGTAIAHALTISSTHSALDALSTRAALTATLQALDSTQIALDRAAAHATQTAVLWPTVARATVAALDTADEQAQIATATMDTLSVILIAVFALVALCLSGWLLVTVWSKIATIAEYHRHDAEMNRAVEDHEWALNAKLWDETRKLLPQPDETQQGIRDSQWRSRLKTFFAAGDERGFSNRKLCPAVLSNRNWGRLVDHLIGAGVLAKDTDAKVGTRWANGYNLARALAELASGAIPLPIWEPFSIAWGGNSQQSNTPETAETLD